MELYINSYGGYLKKKDNCFQVKVDDIVQEIAVKKVNNIVITTGATLTTDAIKFALDNNVDIVFLDRSGKPFGRIWHCKFGSTSKIRRRQLEFAEDKKGASLACGWVVEKINRQEILLKKWMNTRRKVKDLLMEACKSLSESKEKLVGLNGNIEDIRSSVMGIEGNAGRLYFETLSAILPERYRFNGRSRDPARDEFNCLLNYGYGILYSIVEKACIIAGMDPFVGFIHTDGYNKKSLVFDLIEQYRPWVDEVVVGLIANRKVKASYFDQIEGGYVLNKEGKEPFISALGEFFDKKVRYNGRNVQRRNIIQLDCHRIANSLLGDLG
ncbi:CRISPR-associated endonuclease Cas1 [Bacillota bacterium LX-D]|nr:CRISPR-associated endonuclease Cas1 [Bacillota bacterium LX-D]